jgi:hypothetical protein
MADAARAEKVKAELDALASQTNVERVSLPWKDQVGLTYPVISIALDAVVLNPGSHRIKAQLASDPRKPAIDADPFSNASQDAIADLLRNTEGFEDLKANLGEVGQLDPGVVTRKSVLVNANTRAVALRDLGKEYIRVAVLPDAADPGALAKLELALQMRRDFKQDYTFTNQLIFVEDLRAQPGYDDVKVAKAMNLAASSDPAEVKKGAKQAASFTRMLAIVRDVQKRSGGKIPYAFFDDKRQALIDLDAAYEEQKGKDPASARRMKEARLAAILTGSFYRDIRLIDDDSVVDHLLPAIQGNPEIGDELTAVIENVDGGAPVPTGIAALVDDPEPGAAPQDLAPLVDFIAKSYGDAEVVIPAGEGETAEKVDREDFMRQVSESFGDAVTEIKNHQRAAKTLNDPIKLVNEAKANTDKALDAYRKAAGTSEFKIGRLEPPLRKLKYAVEALEREIAKNSSKA